MKKFLLTVLSAAFFLTSGVSTIEAGQGYTDPAPAKKRCSWFGHCRAVTDYQPPKGVFKICCRKVRKYQVLRTIEVPGCGKTSYTEMVVIYRNHYSDGSSHTWTCVVDGSRINQGK